MVKEKSCCEVGYFIHFTQIISIGLITDLQPTFYASFIVSRFRDILDLEILESKNSITGNFLIVNLTYYV